MSQVVYLTQHESRAGRPFTDPCQIEQDRQLLCQMASQVCLLLEYRYFDSPPPHIIHFNRPADPDWFFRIVISRPDLLAQPSPLTVVGFFGERRADADTQLADDFDRTLIDEIPAHAQLLSYSTMAVNKGDFANLVLFADRAGRQAWSKSRAHNQAVQELAPNYYWTVRIYNGRFPDSIHQTRSLTLQRVKYYDYHLEAPWQAIRELS